jgi:hypothetical protein
VPSSILRLVTTSSAKSARALGSVPFATNTTAAWGGITPRGAFIRHRSRRWTCGLLQSVRDYICAQVEILTEVFDPFIREIPIEVPPRKDLLDELL